MDYGLIYSSLVSKAQKESRQKGLASYFEEHHIVPHCMGGGDEETNLVLLTAKEHFLAHALLCEMYPDNRKLKHAFWGMCNMFGNGQDRYRTSARTYERLKRDIADIKRKDWKRNNPMHNPESLAKNVAKRKGVVKRPDLSKQNTQIVTCPYCRKEGAKNSMKRWHFENCTVKTGKKRQHRQDTCVYCGHTSQPMVIRKYHGDNCRYKNNGNLEN